jgi:hypothetical protein
MRIPGAGTVVLAMLALAGGCERSALSKEGGEPRAGAPAQTGGKKGGSTVTPAEDTAAIRKLFDEAESCGDRYHCPALDKLAERAERPGEVRVLQVAFDIMSDPRTNTFERMFQMASATARAWAAARSTQGKKLSIDDERELRAGVMRLLGRADNAVPAHSFVGYLSDARAILEKEALDPRRGNDEVHSAIRSLRDLEPDLSTVKTWLAAKDERPMVAGALMLDGFDHDKLKGDDEAQMVIAFARRADTDPEAARIIARHAAAHGEPAFAPALRAFEHHGDPSVREIAKQALHAPHKP